MKGICLLPIAATLFAQQPVSFEVASVKPNTSGDPSSGMSSGRGVAKFNNNSLRALIELAYNVKDYACSGPSWLDSVRFDVVAKFPEGAKPQQIPEMMQSLLVERFKLAVHREEKEMTGLALLVDKKGLRIQPVEPGVSGTSTGSNMIQGHKITMDEFAHLLSNAIQRPVKDLTGLPGVYDINIKWLPDGPTPADTSDMAGSVYSAVQDRLGLKLQVQKIPVEILVVDHAERAPIEN